MIRKHDRWSELGEENLGELNIQWARKIEEFHNGPAGAGPMTLMKAIMNDYWADNPLGVNDGWDKEKIDMVMSKLYWCWVAWMDLSHMEVGDDEE